MANIQDEMKAALSAIPRDGEYHEVGYPYVAGTRAKRLHSGGYIVDVASADIIGKRDRGPAAVAAMHNSPCFTVDPPLLRTGGVQSVQRAMGRTPRVVT